MKIGTLALDLACITDQPHLVVNTLRLALSCHGYSIPTEIIFEKAEFNSLMGTIQTILKEVSDDYMEGDERPVYASFIKLLKVAAQNTPICMSAGLNDMLAKMSGQGIVITMFTLFPRPILEILLKRLHLVQGTHYHHLLSDEDLSRLPLGPLAWTGTDNECLQPQSCNGSMVVITTCCFSRSHFLRVQPDLVVEEYSNLANMIQAA